MEIGLTATSHARIHFFTLFVMCFLGLFNFPAQAGEFSLLLNGKAIHLDTKPGVRYNESNWGVGFQYDMKPVGEKWVPFYTASEFSDSNSNSSYYFGGGFMHRTEFEWGKTPMHFDAGGIVFLMKRKGFKNDDLFPGLLPAVSLGTPQVALNITFIPKVDPKMVPILFFQLKITL